MKNKLLAMASIILLTLPFSDVALAQGGSSEVCPGCADSTPTPVPPPMDTYSTFGDDWFYITYAVVVTESSGICIVSELEGTGTPAVQVCGQVVPCSPKVTITANIDDDTLWPHSLDWEVTGSGQVGHDATNGLVDRGNGDGVATLYDERVRLQCGEDISSTATFSIELTPTGGYTGIVTVFNDFSFDFSCSPCAGVVVTPL